ncbi:MAG: LptF/LptG family permease [Gemmatimonadaceae bacterium]
MKRLIHPLDRYVLVEFTKILVAAALGFPLLAIVIDATDHLQKYLSRNLSWGQIGLSYLYWIPDSMFMVLPAAVLFAAVFSIGAFTRHSEVTAAKASGISFHRLIAPILLASVFTALFTLFIGELVPVTDRKRNDILEERKFSGVSDRFNFAYEAQHGRVYQISSLNVDRRIIDHVTIGRKGNGPSYPTYLVAAQSANWDTTRHVWMLRRGEIHVLPDSLQTMSIHFDSLRDNTFTEGPTELTATPPSPDEMRYLELRRFIGALERSGADTNELKVELALKLAIPVTCIIIAVFGAPLATSSQRGGAAFGIGISLATTMIFLMLIQLTKAVGQGGVVPPALAAWLPNILFAAIGLVLIVRVRT